MKAVIAGGSGFIGGALARDLSSSGWEVLVLSRSAPDSPSSKSVAWDGRGPGDWIAALEGADVLFNLAGEGVAAGRWTAARKQALRDSRLLATRALVGGLASAQLKPKVFVSASAVGYYGDRGEEELGEDSGPGEDFLAGLCADWEAEAAKAAPLGVRVVCPRIGVVLGAGGGALAKMLTPFKLGLGGPLGGGAQWMPWISLTDLVGLLRFLAAGDASGPVNACAPQPARNRDFAAALGRALRRPAFMPAPAAILRLALGEMASMLLGGQKALPVKALKAGYVFQHPDLDSALAAALTKA